MTATADITEPVRAAYFSVTEGKGKGKFSIAKVLELDESTVHIRLYKAMFTARPSQVDPAELELGTIYDTDGFGIGHLPLSYRAFDELEPVHLMDGTVDEEELEGYRAWRAVGGGHYDGLWTDGDGSPSEAEGQSAKISWSQLLASLKRAWKRVVVP